MSSSSPPVPIALPRSRSVFSERLIAVCCACAAGIITLWGLTLFLPMLQGYMSVGYVGGDFRFYTEAVARWVATGSPYLADQLARPFSTYPPGTFIHPPVALLLFAPFTILPPVLWWAIPLALLAAVIPRWHPAPWTWPLMGLIFCWPRTQGALIVGGTDMWVAAFVALGLATGWAAILIVVKPSFAPLVLIGAKRRRWWVGAVVAAFVCIAFAPLWMDYFVVLRNSPVPWTYSALNLPFVVLPLVAWAGRRQPQPQRQREPSVGRS